MWRTELSENPRFGTENPRKERCYLDPVHHAARTSHSSVDQGTRWDVRTGTQKAARCSAARILLINLPEPLQEALIRFSTILPTVPGRTRQTTRSKQRQPSQHNRTSTYMSILRTVDPPQQKTGFHNEIFISDCGSRQAVRRGNCGHQTDICQQKRRISSQRNRLKNH